MSVIDAYIAELSTVLRGPRRAKVDLLTEARDSLVDAAEAYESSGLEPDAAERRAVADFGGVRQVAPDYQAELGYSQTFRTALLVVVVLAPQDLVWDYASRSLAVDAARDPGPLYSMLSGLMSWLGTGALVGSVLAVLSCGVGARYLGVRPVVVRATGVFAFAVAGVFASAGLLLTLLGPAPLLSVAGLPGLVVVLLLPMAWVAMSGRRCLAAA